MIILNDKKDCCGCHACVQRCPKQCILMREDEEGFLYPYIDTSLCINCGLCEQVCPVINQSDPRLPLKVYAAKNPNETIRQASSSGGLFTMLAEQILQRNGVVFGARFNEKWEVIHDYTETLEGLAAFRGSKYVQSRIGDNYRLVKAFLEQDREVLFSGTPCQVAGLKCFLRKEYNNLLTVDIICHGVPSPGVWRMYLKETITRECKEKAIIENISFRDKHLGWKKFSFALSLSIPDIAREKKQILLSDIFSNNIFMKGFLADLYLRPSCYSCPSKCGKSGSDITLGDFWGIENVLPNYDDEQGISAVLVYNSISCKMTQKPSIENYHELTYQDVFVGNSPLEHSSYQHPNRVYFFSLLKKHSPSKSTRIALKKGRWNRLIRRIMKRIINRIRK